MDIIETYAGSLEIFCVYLLKKKINILSEKRPLYQYSFSYYYLHSLFLLNGKVTKIVRNSFKLAHILTTN